MELKKLMVDTKSAWMDYPGLEGFSVEVVNLSRKELTALRRRCTTTKFDRKTITIVSDDNLNQFKCSGSTIKFDGFLKLTRIELSY